MAKSKARAMAKSKARARRTTKAAARRTAARRARPRRRAARRRPAVRARKAAARPTRRKAAARKRVGTRPSRRRTARPRAARPKRAATTPARSHRPPPALDRERRVLEDTTPGPPSSLAVERHGSAARTGRAELLERLEQHRESGPALTGGDVDADWEEAYSSGDEAPGGDNPTPDQDVVEELGRSLGVQYADNEELRSGEKIADRDRHRWELDPASAEDYQNRSKP